VAIAIDIIDPVDRAPVLIHGRLTGREAALSAGVLAVPVLVSNVQHGVGGMAQGAFLGGEFAPLDLGDFLADSDHSVDKAIKFVLRLRLGRLDHQGSGHRKAHGGGMKAKVDQALGNVFGGDVAAGLEGPGVEDALVGHPAFSFL